MDEDIKNIRTRLIAVLNSSGVFQDAEEIEEEPTCLRFYDPEFTHEATLIIEPS